MTAFSIRMTGVVLAACLAPVIPARAASESVVYSFQGGSDGADPDSGLINVSGALYGTTRNGGPNNDGTVYKLVRNGNAWTETVLYSFTGSPNDGVNPQNASLIVDDEGNLYGTTTAGGAANVGTVFKLVPNGNSWTETVLHSFTGGSDGAYPEDGLIEDNAGNLYGTTNSGGAGSVGTVFKLKLNGNLKVLYTFTNGSNGAHPYAGLIRKNGYFYGTTYEGGTNCGGSGCGVVFKLKPGGSESVLYSFTGQPGDGANPFEGFIEDKAGNLFGTTIFGGTNGDGAVFKLVPNGDSWTEALLHSFTGGSDGANPSAGLIKVGDKFYGTTSGVFVNGYGTVYSVTNTGTEKPVYSFCSQSNCSDGANPASTLIDVGGKLYGATQFGGANGLGAVFAVTP